MNEEEIFRNPEEPDDGPAEDLEVEDRVNEWLDSNRVENSTPAATLYKFHGPTGEGKDQCDYYKGVIPTRHEIGLEYGAGKYMLILTNSASGGRRKATTIRFRLHENYDLKRAVWLREKAEKDRQTLYPVQTLPVPGTPAPDAKQSFLEALAIARQMQNETLQMFRPLIERALSPAAPIAPARSPFEDFALSKQIMRESLKENMSMMGMVRTAMLENKQGDSDEMEETEEKTPGMFEKIIALAEPFINILAANNNAAKMAAAGIKAAPQFREVLKDSGLARRIIGYVENKEGPERAAIVLKNLGVNKGDYVAPGNPPLVSVSQAPRRPAPAPVARVVSPAAKPKTKGKK